jgi:hypothetical protein
LFDPEDDAADEKDKTLDTPVEDVPNGSGGTNVKVNGE